jgi:hypothetical protein
MIDSGWDTPLSSSFGLVCASAPDATSAARNAVNSERRAASSRKNPMPHLLEGSYQLELRAGHPCGACSGAGVFTRSHGKV